LQLAPGSLGVGECRSVDVSARTSKPHLLSDSETPLGNRHGNQNSDCFL
jgi:hypothetical protein